LRVGLAAHRRGGAPEGTPFGFISPKGNLRGENPWLARSVAQILRSHKGVIQLMEINGSAQGVQGRVVGTPGR